jgi:hypothetical protein
VIVVGGSGWDIASNEFVTLTFDGQGLTIGRRPSSDLVISIADICDIELSGGSDIEGGGFAGGGFGLEGAAIGMAAATALNALTTRKTTVTLLHITTESGELFLLHTPADPLDVRIALSATFTALRIQNA